MAVCSIFMSSLSPSLTAADLTSVLQSPAPKSFPELLRWKGTCNSYVLRNADSALVIDLGNGEVLEQLAAQGVRNVEWLLFTDHHREGCQGIAAVDRATKVAAAKTEQELFENPTAFRKWFPKLGDK
jgi:glyoxylase-like metal-dependent hydrolase (beta-lactamase superfamily II)